jgi:flagellar biosynthesis protein
MKEKYLPPPQAVALHYDGKRAPTVIAKGSGDIARQILAIADKHKIPLREDPELLGLLAKLDMGQQIPESLYIAVAQIIAFAYYISGKSPPPPG